MELALHDIVAGLIGLGMVAKGFLDHNTSKRQLESPVCACKYEPSKHAICIDTFKLEFDRVNMKLDNIEERMP